MCSDNSSCWPGCYDSGPLIQGFVIECPSCHGRCNIVMFTQHFHITTQRQHANDIFCGFFVLETGFRLAPPAENRFADPYGKALYPDPTAPCNPIMAILVKGHEYAEGNQHGGDADECAAHHFHQFNILVVFAVNQSFECETSCLVQFKPQEFP